MLAIYFSARIESSSPLWHPIEGMPGMTSAQANLGAIALATVFPEWRWAWGPRYQDGVIEVYAEDKEASRG